MWVNCYRIHQKLLNFIYPFKFYSNFTNKNVSWLHFSWATQYIDTKRCKVLSLARLKSKIYFSWVRVFTVTFRGWANAAEYLTVVNYHLDERKWLWLWPRLWWRQVYWRSLVYRSIHVERWPHDTQLTDNDTDTHRACCTMTSVDKWLHCTVYRISARAPRDYCVDLSIHAFIPRCLAVSPSFHSPSVRLDSEFFWKLRGINLIRFLAGRLPPPWSLDSCNCLRWKPVSGAVKPSVTDGQL